MKNIWKDGVLGVVVGDALGCPVQFKCRELVADQPVTAMRGYGTFSLPAGSWTDDSSLTLALLDSIGETGRIDLDNIMKKFVSWLDKGLYTPYGYAYDIGGGTMKAIRAYALNRDPYTCGGDSVTNNGNGALMRILPACLYCYRKGLDDDEAVRVVHEVGALTHAHIRSKIACGLYWFMVKSVLDGDGPLIGRLQTGLDRGFSYYEDMASRTAADADLFRELACYDRLRDLAAFARVPAEDINNRGYVVYTMEAAVWSLITTASLEEMLLKAVNLGDDTDTVGAVGGGLAGLYYGSESIPAEWLAEIKRLDWIEELCVKADAAV